MFHSFFHDVINFVLYPNRKTNAAHNGVWVYKIGSSPFFLEITPGTVSSSRENEGSTESPLTTLPRQTDHLHFSTYTTQMMKTAETVPKEKQGYPSEITSDYHTTYSEAETITPGTTSLKTQEPHYYVEPEKLDQEHPESETVAPASTSTERVQQRYPDQPEPRSPEHSDRDLNETRYSTPETLQPIITIPAPRYSPDEPRYATPDPVQPRYTEPEPVQPVPPHSPPQHPQIVVVDEDEDLDVNGRFQKQIFLFCFVFCEALLSDL